MGTANKSATAAHADLVTAESALKQTMETLRQKLVALGLDAVEIEANATESAVIQLRSDSAALHAHVDAASKLVAELESKQAACNKIKHSQDRVDFLSSEQATAATDFAEAEKWLNAHRDAVSETEIFLRQAEGQVEDVLGAAEWDRMRSETLALRSVDLVNQRSLLANLKQRLGASISSANEEISVSTGQAKELKERLLGIYVLPAETLTAMIKQAELTDQQIIGLKKELHIRVDDIRKRRSDAARTAERNERRSLEMDLVEDFTLSALDSFNPWLLTITEWVPSLVLPSRLVAGAALRDAVLERSSTSPSGRSQQKSSIGPLQAVIDSKLRDVKRRSAALKKLRVEIQQANDSLREANDVSNHIDSLHAKADELLTSEFELSRNFSIAVSQGLEVEAEIASIRSFSPVLPNELDLVKRVGRDVSVARVNSKESAAIVDSKRAQLASIEQSLSTQRNETESMKSLCVSFKDRDLRRAQRALETHRKRLASMSLELGKQDTALLDLRRRMKEESQADPVVSDLIALSGIHRTARDLAHAEELTATKNQTYWMGELKRAMEAVSELERRNVSLWKRRGELETESPKLEIEWGLKDELVHNITKKQADSKIVMAELTEPIHRQKINFTEWEARLEFIDSEIARVNQSLSEILAAKPESAFNMTEYNTARGEFNNISSYLNATYFNLSVAEESAVNTTKRIEELVVEFKQTERTYFEKERILKEYTDKVDQGLIPKVEFKFEY